MSKERSLVAVPILELPHPKLRQRARKIRQIDKNVLKIAYDMVDTLREAGGLGLAANQIGVLRRIIVVQLPDENEETRIYINPEILGQFGQREVEEGCLSVPGYRGTINRSVWVKFRALDHSSKVVQLETEDLLAQVLEHEVDHLNGILYLDHLASHDDLVKISPGEMMDDSAGVSTNNYNRGEVDYLTTQSMGTQARSVESPATTKIR